MASGRRRPHPRRERDDSALLLDRPSSFDREGAEESFQLQPQQEADQEQEFAEVDVVGGSSRRPRLLSKRSSSDAGRYDDALLLAEVSKIAEDEAHHRTGTRPEAAAGAATSIATGTSSGGAKAESGGSSASSDGDAAGGLHVRKEKIAAKKGGGVKGGTKDMTTEDEKDDRGREKEDHGGGGGGNAEPNQVQTTPSAASDDGDVKARKHFSDNAKLGALASPILRSDQPSSSSQGEGADIDVDSNKDKMKEEEETDANQQQKEHPSPIQLEQPKLDARTTASIPPRYCHGHYIGGPVPRPYSEYGNYYSAYPPLSMPTPMQDHPSSQMSDSYAGKSHPLPGIDDDEQFYSPGGPYPAVPPYLSYRFGGGGAGVPIPMSSDFDQQDHRPEHGDGGGDGPLPPPEYTPPAPHFTRHAPRRPSKHVEVTPNSHADSPSSHRLTSHSRDEDSVTADAGSSDDKDHHQEQQRQPQRQRQQEGDSGPQPSLRRARFDETTERDQEDRDRRRAAAAEAFGSAGGVVGAAGQTIPPFPSPRHGLSLSSGSDLGGGQKPYLPPPRPSSGSRFPYRDDGTGRGGAGFVPTAAPSELSRWRHPLKSGPASPPQESYYDGSWSPYPLHQHRRVPSAGSDGRFPIFDSPGAGQGSTWGASASWDNEDDGRLNQALTSVASGSSTAPGAAPRTPRKGHRKGIPSVSIDYDDSPPGNVLFTPRSSFDPMQEGRPFLPPTPGGYYNDPADYADYGADYEYGAGYAQSHHPQHPHLHPQDQHRPPPHMMMPRPQQAPFHPGSPRALAQRQFSTPGSSGSSKYPPLSAFQGSHPAGGGYYSGGEDYYTGKTVIRRKCPWKNFPEVSCNCACQQGILVCS